MWLIETELRANNGMLVNRNWNVMKPMPYEKLHDYYFEGAISAGKAASFIPFVNDIRIAGDKKGEETALLIMKDLTTLSISLKKISVAEASRYIMKGNRA